MPTAVQAAVPPLPSPISVNSTMFTVKATYRNETRRFTFSDSVLFPTYEELHNQLCRVFPISHHYYLSRLIFSTDAPKPGRILVGKEVHSAEDYDSCVIPLRRLWPNPLLRFTIFDETPHEAPSVASKQLSPYNPPMIPLSEVSSRLSSTGVPHHTCMVPSNPPLPQHSSASCVLPPPPSPSKMFPPPSIIFSPTPSKSCSPQKYGTAGVVPCCPVAKGKADIEILLSSFKGDLEHILSRTFGTGFAENEAVTFVKGSTSETSGVDVVPPRTETLVSAGVNASRWCFVCRTSFTGVWYGCIKCPWHAVCPSCFSKSHSAHTLSFGPSHVVQQRSTDCSTQVSAHIARETTPRSGVSETFRPPGLASGLAGEPALAVHRGVICDSCSKTIVGIRHKCLDCSDYDLCTACMESGATEQHNSFHEFFDIETPGRVYVHTVLGGDSDRSLGNRQQVANSNHILPTQQGPAAISIDPPVRHSATCNLCDSAIVGERYKCVICPDFDTCSSCFRITTEQHPSHGFVRVNKPEDLMMRDSIPARQAAHSAECDSCRKAIYGARYKCMHPGCSDFDLCSDCEALPIPVHPLNHPLLKLKASDTLIPTVHGLGLTQRIDEQASPRSAPVCGEFRSPPLLSRDSLVTQVKSPEIAPATVSDQVANAAAGDQTPLAEEFLSPLGSPASHAQGIVPTFITTAPSHLLVDFADSPGSPQPTHTASDIYHQLLPIVNQEMMHLTVMQAQKAENPVINPAQDIVTKPTINDMLITEEPLPETPTASISRADEHHGTCPVSPVPVTNSNGDGYHTPSPTLPSVQELNCRIQQLPDDDHQEIVAANSLPQGFLDSALVGDTNVPGGQIFPPGAEFVKGWRMMNNGRLSWPTSTEVQFVAGEMFALECSAALKAKVGVVQPGQDLDIWTGDLKAPDVPGRYVGYWRLRDGQGNFFGSTVWIDLTVADHQSDQASGHSLASSSMVMPSAHPTSSDNANDGLQAASQPSLPSSKIVTDEDEDAVSDVSSVSLVSVPTSDDDDAEWQDTRTHSEPLEYVVLYDGNSEE